MILIFKQHHDEKNTKKVLKQKDFVLKMVSILIKKGEHARQQNLHLPPLFIDPLSLDFSSPNPNNDSQSQSSSVSMSNSHVGTSTRSSRTASLSVNVPKSVRENLHQFLFSSFPKQLHLPSSLHIRSTKKGNKQCRCLYCSIKYQERDENEGGVLNRHKMVNCTQSKCNYCSVFVCRKHFDCFHSDF